MTTWQSIIQRELNTCGRCPGPASSPSACLARFVAAHRASVAGQIVSKVALAWHRPGSEAATVSQLMIKIGRSKEAARLAGGSEAVGALTTATSSSHLETACSDSPC